jgi:hypothetical protein
MPYSVPSDYVGVMELQALDGARVSMAEIAAVGGSSVFMCDGTDHKLRREDLRLVRLWFEARALLEARATRYTRSPGYVQPEQHLPH